MQFETVDESERLQDMIIGAVETEQEFLIELVKESERLGLYDDPLDEDDIASAKILTGFGHTYDLPADTVDRLIRFGIAADAGDGQLMRGFKWSQFVK